MTTARDDVLRRIRESLRDVPAGEAPEAVPVLRTYRRAESAPVGALLDLLVDRLEEYRAAVRRVDRAGLPGAIAGAIADRGVRRLVVPADLPGDWEPSGVELLRDPGLTDEQLDGSDGVLTGCSLAIAQTGTIVLDGGPAQGRRALTLLPDYHLCVVDAEQVVGLVPEAVARLADAARTPGRTMTWISGPSATSDIELSRVEGVHGPRNLEVLVVSPG